MLASGQNGPHPDYEQTGRDGGLQPTWASHASLRRPKRLWSSWTGRRRFGLSALGAVTLILASVTFASTVACGSRAQTVVFTSDRDGNLELYSVAIDGGGTRNLTSSSVDEFSPTISPDGKLVAFLSGSEASNALEVMHVDGNERQRLAPGPGPGKYRSYRWSPDSSRLAYVSENGVGRLIYVVDVDGSGSMLLTTISGDEVGDWSPDGRSIVFTVREGDEQGLYIRNPDGVNRFRLTHSPDFSPVWSPDSTKIAFLSLRDGNPELYVMNPDGTEQKRLTENDAAEYDVSWSPDGTRLLFVSERDGSPEIYVADPDGGLVRLTVNDVRDDQPVWSPDGQKVAFVSYLDGDAEIFVMDADGSDQTRLTNNDFEDTNPSW